jgi:hypothetical protein
MQISCRYKWDKFFNVSAFLETIHRTNVNEVSQWISTDIHSRLEPFGLDDRYKGTNELAKYRRTVCAPTVVALLGGADHTSKRKKRRVDETDTEGSKKNDLMLQVLLPCEFATYANALVARAQVQAGLAQTPLLIPVVSDSDSEDPDDEEPEMLYFWRIGKDLMWQQLDRRIDEYVLSSLASNIP